MTKTARIIIAVIATGGLVGGAAFLYILVTAPRMTVQPHVRTYQVVLPGLPAGSVPVRKAQAPALRLSLERGLAAGKQCYEYYCVFCHGRKGDGSGPVGQSYDVTPTNLRQSRFAAMTDQDLVTAMLKGVGHEPVLGYVVPEEYRQVIAAYVKTFATVGR